MKSVLITLFAFLLIIPQAPGQSKLPNSIVNISGGFGGNYGFLGSKTVVGPKNSGVMIGLGHSRSGQLVYQLGGQISYKWLYVDLSYGSPLRRNDDATSHIVRGGNLLVGAMLGLGTSRRSFIDLGIGQYFNASTKNENISTHPWVESVNFAVGFGYRIGDRKK